MNKQFIISVVVMFIWTMLVGFVVHATLLGADYAALPDLYRQAEDQEVFFPYMLLGHLFLSIGLTWVYRMGRQDKPWLAQGVRFALAIIVLMTLSNYLIYFAVQPMPASLTIRQIVFDSLGMVTIGILLAFLNREASD